MSINLGELRAKITVATSEAEASVKGFEDKLSDTSDVLNDVGGRLVKMGTVGVGAITALALKGADWNAQVAGTQFLFDNLDKTVQSSINSNLKNAEAIGLTVQQYKDGATNISTYYKNMGMTSKEISNMSAKTMELVADLGAVVDLPFDEALARFKSGLMGNYEALDIFGISISASMLENSEYVKSLGKTWKQLSDNEKMLAVYNEIQRQGASATGLARQEASQFSMQMKLLKQELSETAGTIGETLLPILQPFLEGVRSAVKGLRSWVEEHPRLTGAILGIVGAISVLNVITGTLIITIASCISTFLFWKTVLTPIVLFLKGKLIATLIASSLQFGIFTAGAGSAVGGLIAFLGKIPLVGTALAGMVHWIGVGITALLGLTPAGILGLVIKGFRLFSLTMLVTGGDIDGFVKKLGNALKTGLEYITTNLPKWIESGKEIVKGIITGISENLPLIIEKAGEILKALYDGLVGSIQIILEVGGAIIDGIVQGIVVGLPILLEEGQKLLGMLVQGIVNGLPLLIEAVTIIINNFTLWIENSLPVFIEKGTNILVNLIEGITSAIPLIVDVIVQIITAFTEGLAIYLPLILETGVNILVKLIEGIINALPYIIQAGVSIIEGLISSIVMFLPVVITTGVTLLTTLIDGIISMLPLLIDAGLKLIMALINGIVQNLPKIIDAGILLILKLADAIIQNLPKIIDAGIRVLTALINGIIKMLPQLIQAGIKLVVTLVSALIQNLPKLVSAGGQLLKAIVTGVLQLIGTLIQAGVKLVVSLAKSVVSNAPKMLQAGKDLVKAVINGVGQLGSSLWKAGKGIVNSILDGIKGAWGSLTGWVSKKVSSLNPFKKRKMVVGIEGTVDDSGISPINSLARNSIMDRPSHFGFTPRNGLFNLNIPDTSTGGTSTTKETFDSAKEIVINTILECDGYQIAKASARYMKDEISALDRRAVRLGGVL